MIKQAYQRLSAKDRKALNVLLVFLLGASLYFVWHQLHLQAQELSENVQYQQDLNQYIVDNRAKIQSLRLGERIVNQQPLFNQIEDMFESNEIAKEGVNLSRQTENKVTVSIQSVSFEILLKKIQILSSQQLIVDKITITRLKEPGLVRVEMVVVN